MARPTLQRSAKDTFRAFSAVLRSANNLVPGVVLLGAIVTVPLVLLIASQAKLITAATVLVVLIVAIAVFIRRNNFGEAAIALVAGLFPALSIDWTAGKFVAFSIAWILLAAITLMIGSVRLAAEYESIYTDAATASSVEAREFRELSDSYSGHIGPVEKASVLRLLAYRGLAIGLMKTALRDTDMLATVTRLDVLVAAGFIGDLYRINPSLPEDHLNSVESAIHQSASSPSEFLAAFNQSRHVALSGKVELMNFLQRLAEALKSGLSPEQIAQSW
jgi:hypothetical protein